MGEARPLFEDLYESLSSPLSGLVVPSFVLLLTRPVRTKPFLSPSHHLFRTANPLLRLYPRPVGLSTMTAQEDPSADQPSPLVHPPVEVSPLDTRSYRAVTLPNQLRVLIVSDTESDKAAASLDVAVGNFSDPPELPGLAHFLEHMLFLGTAKYPEEGSYNAFLAENGGHSNAYTASENTNFHFSMVVSDRDTSNTAPRFREALDRFAQFFIAPLFTESATDRELNAVHSEHQKNLQNDSRRVYQLKRSSANPKHPLSKFGTGSKETLYDIPRDKNIDTRARLLEFYHEYYSANLMNLCIIAPHDLDTLQDWVVELFSPIPNQNRENPCEEYRCIDPLLEEHSGLIFHVDTVCDIRFIELSWAAPTYIQDYRAKPGHLVSSFLGDEGEGSILSLLKQKGWASNCIAGTMEYLTFSAVQVTLMLTNEGVDYIDEIIGTVYQYIRMLQKCGVPRRLYEEEAGLAEIGFRFEEREEPFNFVTRISSRMQHMEPSEFLSGQVLYKDFNEEKTRNFIDALTPQLGNIFIAGRFVSDTDRTEKWYETPYRVERLDASRIASWWDGDIDPALHLPKENPFIPSEFSILGEPLAGGEKDKEGPRIIERNKHFELFYKLDRTFERPTAYINMSFWTPAMYMSPWHGVMGSLFTALLEDSLTEFSYPAERAGFSYRLDRQPNGFVLAVEGYSHRIDVFLNAVVSKMKNFEVDKTRFEMQKDLLERRYANFDKGQPISNAMYHAAHLVEEPHWHVYEYVASVKGQNVTPDDMKTYAQEVVQRVRMTSLVCGNIHEADAIKMMRSVQSTLAFEPLAPSEMITRRAARLPVEREVFYRIANPNTDDNNSAIEVFFQVGPRGEFEPDVKLELLAEILNKPAFHELRTVQQLGYMVFEGVSEQEGVRGIHVMVQSTIADPDELLKRIDTFLVDVRKDVLEPMTEDKFSDYVRALCANKGEPDQNMRRRVRRFLSEINRGLLRFDRAEREIEALRNIGKDEVIKLFDEFIAVGGAQRRKLVVQVYGNAHPFAERKVVPNGAEEVDDAVEFRRSCPMHAVVGRPYPVSRKE